MLKETEKQILENSTKIDVEYKKVIDKLFVIINANIDDLNNKEKREAIASATNLLTNFENLRKQNINNINSVRVHFNEDNYKINIKDN